jgi:hypothetical protein
MSAWAAFRMDPLESAQIDPFLSLMIALADGIGVRLSALIPKDREGGQNA